MSKRNPRTIVLFMVDQLAARWLEVAGQGVVRLPNFEALQAEGVTFERGFSANPVCSPSRASIATGMSHQSHGVSECGYDLDPGVPTFMRELQTAGWRTGGFGKLHFITQIETLTPDYHPYGFDVVCNTEDSRAGEWLDWVAEHHPEHYEAALSTVWMTMSNGLDEYGPDKVDLASAIRRAQERYPESTTEAYELPFPAEVSQTAWITDRACDFIASAGDRDVFAQVSYVQPHNPFAPPAEYVERVDVDAIPEPTPADWMSRPIPYFRQDRYASPSYEQRDWRRERQLYFADLAHLDHELGRIRNALHAAGRVDETLFIFTSDHGELLHDHGLVGKWERHYDACIRIPLIISAPNSAPGRREQLVEHTDITATIYDWAGVRPPAAPLFRRNAADEELPLLHGRSLLPAISDPAAPGRSAVYVQSNNSHVEVGPSSWARTIRTPQYRYTRYLGNGGEQLFDLLADPDEQHNLANDPSAARIRQQLSDELLELIAAEGFPNSPRQLYKVGTW
ncbi:sulfatase-like hydrolase/transferase [Saccharopolyspora shandongensis]|uniref:sulfatase family protein n=1 Tax=Saccharopolyspora shandongensis TaxID=418495 RepID=UPI003432DC89